MKRDLDVVRQALLSVEEKSTFEGVWTRDFPVPEGINKDDFRRHLILLASADLLVCEKVVSSTTANRVIDVLVFDLSWSGYEYLDAIRDPKVWKQAKLGMSRIGSGGFDVLVAIAKAVAKQKLHELGLPL